jgi:hypothetical protein
MLGIGLLPAITVTRITELIASMINLSAGPNLRVAKFIAKT